MTSCISGVADWSAWSSCSKSCDGGEQVRKRNCTNNDECDDVLDKRICNSFSCDGIKTSICITADHLGPVML